MSDWIRAAGTIAGEVASELRRARRRLRGDATPPLQIVPYHGYGRQGLLRVQGRVVEDREIAPASADDPWWQNLISAYRRLDSEEVPNALVKASARGVQVDSRADGEGFFLLELPLSVARGRLWHSVELELVEPPRDRPVRATAEILVPPAAARFGVISDIDDTVVRTRVGDVVSMARDVLLGNAHTRLPFDGVAPFYRALQRGSGGARGSGTNPIFYVSSSPWNLYDVLLEFMDIHGIPIGPLELRDWGMRLTTLPLGHRRHKLGAIHSILRTYPELPFILVGDSGQHDPEIYSDLVRDYPDRILAAYIRSVSPDPARPAAVRALAREVAAAGSDLVLADDTLAAARHAEERGWIDGVGLTEVEAEVERARTHGEDGPGPERGTRRGSASSMQSEDGDVVRTAAGAGRNAAPESDPPPEYED